MKYKIVGSKNKLFSMHGMVETDKTLDALANLSESYELNIDKINDASEKAGIYVTESGRILPGFTGNDERRARYKLVPTGLFQKYTEYPLLASFIKSQCFWEGPFVGTATQLFEMYKQHTKRDSFCEDYKQYFSGSCRVLDLVGFGLDELKEARKNIEGTINKNEETEDDKDDSIARALEKALEGIILKDDDGDSSEHPSKEKRKKQRLEQTLEKVKKAEEKKEKQELEKAKEEIESAVDVVEQGDIDFEDDTQENEEEVIQEMDHDNAQIEQEKYKYKMQLKWDLIEDIYERLLIKENWKATNKNRLGFYLKGLMLLIHKRQRDLPQEVIKGNGYTFSDNSNKYRFT